jgi:hypothetical protein
MSEELSEDLILFLNTIPSIPYLEAILLFRGPPVVNWDKEGIARRLYMSQDQARMLIGKLCKANICKQVKGRNTYIYAPKDEDLASMITRLANYYAQNLVLVTNIIHANSSKHSKAQQFADTFKWKAE